MKTPEKVFVAMSGGVDSSLAAALLQEQGYEAVGVYMKNWTQDIIGFKCPWMDDFQDAKRVATKLNIDFKIFDFQKEYKQKVVDYMVDEYKAGRTPNPDIMCNQEIKFKLFLNTALQAGADLIATGHWARIIENELYTAKNSQKDQTYFLYRTGEKSLRKSLFPVGEYKSKVEVRALAKKLGLPTAEKKDSRGICFVGEVGIKEFLSQYVKTEPGPIVDHNGKEIGEHEGAIFYTIGQRHGLNIGGGLPYYVTRKDMTTNTVFVTTDLSEKDLWSKKITLEDIHWISENPDSTKTYKVRLRHRGPLIACSLKKNKLTLKDEQRAISAGQSAVLYEGSRVLGGGIISQVS
jgi:tRNA-specific 2-thiouridylase